MVPFLVPLLLSLLPLFNSLQISDVTPTSYSLLFTVYVEYAQYQGLADIKFDLHQSNQQIVLHGRDFNIHRIMLYQERVQIKTQYNMTDGFLSITREDGEGFQPASYFLRIQYSNSIHKKLTGIYLSEYLDDDDNVHKIVGTHFEPTEARSAYPCFDLPHLKAPFTITIDHESKYHVISNTLIKDSRQITPTLTRTSFLPTPPMSTYLVAFVLSDYGYISKSSSSGVLCRAFFIPGREAEVVPALDIMTKSIDFYEDYITAVFPLPKLDIVPLPAFGIGAMENWGLITIREEFYYTDNETRFDHQLFMKAIITHEVAHMWFGDSVSLSSWNDLWLKEGMAQMLMFVALEKMAEKHPDPSVTISDIQGTMLAFNFFPAIKADSSPSTHALSMDLNSTGEATSAFDAVSYAKGASLMNMLRYSLGEKALRHGLSDYIHKYKHKSATLLDFLGTMDTAGTIYGGLSVTEFLNKWISQAGYPVVTIKKVSPKKYRISQSMFIEGQNKKLTGRRWPVLITLKTNKKRHYKVMLSGRARLISFNYEPDFVKLNVDSVMFFRTNYDTEMMRNVSALLEEDHTVFSPEDRMGLISDAVTMGNSGRINMTDALRVTRYLGNETSYPVWNQAINNLEVIRKRLASDASVLNSYMSLLLTPLLDREYRNDTMNEVMLKDLVDYRALQYGVEALQETAVEEFQLWEADPDYIINSEYFLYAVTNLGKEQLLWTKYIEYDYPEITIYSRALSASNNQSLVRLVLQDSLHGDRVPLQNKGDLLQTVATRHPSLALQFLQHNYQLYFQLLGQAQFLFNNILVSVIGNLKTQADLKSAQDFFSDKDLGAGVQGYHLGLDKVKDTIAWRECCEKDTIDYFKSFQN